MMTRSPDRAESVSVESSARSKKSPLRFLAYLLWRRRLGYCPICGRQTAFVRIGSRLPIRDDFQCIWCRCSARTRHLALTLARSLSSKVNAGIRDIAGNQDRKIFHAAASGPLSKALGTSPNVTHSEYFEDVPPGQMHDGVLCQDIQRLTFTKSSFDVVITEEVFEHVQDFRQGFSEVLRVLKPGGLHVFTIPFSFDETTRPLMTWENGSMRVLVEPIEFHGDSIRNRIPVVTRFGYDFFGILDTLGFDTKLVLSDYDDAVKHAVFCCHTFVSRKRSG